MLEPSKVRIIFAPSILLIMLLLALQISFLKYSNIEEREVFIFKSDLAANDIIILLRPPSSTVVSMLSISNEARKLLTLSKLG